MELHYLSESKPELIFARTLSRLCGGAFNDDAEVKNKLRSLDDLIKTKWSEEDRRQKDNPTSPSTLRFQNWKRSGLGKDNIRVELFVLFHCDGGSQFTAALLKAWLKGLYLSRLHETDKRRYIAFVEQFDLCGAAPGQEPEEKVDEARKAAAKPTYKPAVSSVTKTNFIPRLREALGYIFPSFTGMRGFLAQEGDPASASGGCMHGYFGWPKFDSAAYEEAIKSPHQIRQKQKERDKEAKQLDELKKLYEGKGREKGKSDDGGDEDFIPGGFSESGGDVRFAAMKRVHEEMAVADGVDHTKAYRYGISQAALRGYEELREAWNREVEPGEPFSGEKARKLKDRIVLYQRQHRDDMGDSRFFEELIKQGNWCVWQAAAPELESERAKMRYSTNIVRDYLRYSEVLEDLEKKRKPVQYTPADARESRRLLDFKGTSQGRFEHLGSSEGLSFTTQIAVRSCKGDKELYRRQDVRISYAAPRLLRDGARVLREDEELESANWAQPLMRALGIPADDTHNFRKHAVSLMPDWKPGSQSPQPDRLLLNFVLAPDEDRFVAHLRKQMGRKEWPWAMQFNWNADRRNSTLRWPHEDWSRIERKDEFPGHWFANAELRSFRLLSVDLGQKQAGAYAIMEMSCTLPDEDKKHARFVGRTDHNGKRRDWYARVLTKGLLKLPGEDAAVFRPEYREGKPVPGSEDFREELYGSAGRSASKSESETTLDVLRELHQLELLDENDREAAALSKHLSLPEQNTKLLIAFRRAQSFASRLHRWCWFLDPQDETARGDQAVRRRAAIEEIAEADEHAWLQKGAHMRAKARNAQLLDAKEEPESHPEIVSALKKELESLIEKLPRWLEIIAHRVYTSRTGKLVWRSQPDREGCHLLDFTLRTAEERKQLTKEEMRLAGQRGLAIQRIEQLEELRKRCQSLNQMVRREIGTKPKLSRDEGIPDPCPTILAKLDEIKAQRQNQTAHMILRQALGLTLAEPNQPKDDAEGEAREAMDSHGEYAKVDAKGQMVSDAKGNTWRGVVDFIVIEDLTRYRTSQGRAPCENSRLMKWCHQAVRDKLKQMCEPFGLPLLETPAAYSSRFCSRTGVAGFRAVELSGNPLEGSKWRWRIHKPEGGKTETKDQTKRREQWELLLRQVQKANQGRDGNSKGQKFRTLLVPDAGGSIFVPISALDTAYTRPGKNPGDTKLRRPIIELKPVSLEENQIKKPRLVHADINAAVNLGLRAIADPQLWSVHSRLRSEREFGTPPKPKTKEGKPKNKTHQPEQATAEMIKPDTFWVSERERRRYGERTADNRIGIVLCSVAQALAKSAGTKDESEKRKWLERAQEKTPKAGDSRHPNFFDDVANLKAWIHESAAILSGVPAGSPEPFHLVTGKALWGYVKDQAWKRCMAINAARLRAWGIEPPNEWGA